MRESNSKGKSSEPIDPVLLAFARLPFDWNVKDSHKIPFSFTCLGPRTGEDDSGNSSSSPLTVALNWMPQDDMAHNLHVEFIFFHRPLKGSAISYDDVESIIRKDTMGILPRIILTAVPNNGFRVDYRHRSDFLEVVACLLEQGTETTIPEGDWTYITAYTDHIPSGACTFFHCPEERLSYDMRFYNLVFPWCSRHQCPFLYDRHSITKEVIDPFNNVMDQSGGYQGILEAFKEEQESRTRDFVTKPPSIEAKLLMYAKKLANEV